MGLTLEATMQDSIADHIDDLVNTGAGTATLKFETAGDVEVASFDLQNPAFSTAAAGLLTLQGLPLTASSVTGGTVAQFSIYDRDGAKQFEGVVTVTGGGGDITIGSLTIPAAATLNLTSFALQVPA